jgi:hypothetical protein
MNPKRVASVSSINPVGPPIQRTDWAELEVEDFLSIPFISEFVFRNLRTMDGKSDHQSGDFLLFNGAIGILVEQKCQKDPASRKEVKTALWARKNAKAAWSQLRRALTRPKGRAVWCDHPRMGRK